MKRIRGFDIANNLILLILALFCIYPFLYILFIAVSDGTYLARGLVSFFPKGINLESFKYVLTNPRIKVFVGLRNSFIYTILGTVVAIPGAISTQFLIIAKTFLDGIPKEIEEAAFVDGANDWVIMTKIYMPLCTTLFATIGTFYAISIWNQYLLPQIYLKSEGLQTIQQILKSVVITDSSSGTTFQNVIVNGITLNQDNLKAAAIFIAMLPIVCLYPFVQKYFKKGLLLGSVKG